MFFHRVVHILNELFQLRRDLGNGVAFLAEDRITEVGERKNHVSGLYVKDVENTLQVIVGKIFNGQRALAVAIGEADLGPEFFFKPVFKGGHVHSASLRRGLGRGLAGGCALQLVDQVFSFSDTQGFLDHPIGHQRLLLGII